MASPAPWTFIIIIPDHIIHVWGWLREVYLRNGEETIFYVESAWVLPTLGSVRTQGDRMSVKMYLVYFIKMYLVYFIIKMYLVYFIKMYLM